MREAQVRKAEPMAVEFDFEDMAQRVTLVLLTRPQHEWPEIIEDLLRHTYGAALTDASHFAERILLKRACMVMDPSQKVRGLTARERLIKKLMERPTEKAVRQ